MRPTHKHRCHACGRVWEHDTPDLLEMLTMNCAENRARHTCPECGLHRGTLECVADGDAACVTSSYRKYYGRDIDERETTAGEAGRRPGEGRA